MGLLFLLLLLGSSIGVGILFFNKGQKAVEIKTVIKAIALNIKDLFDNLVKLYSILKEIIISEEELDSNEKTSLPLENTESQGLVANNDDSTKQPLNVEEPSQEVLREETSLAENSENSSEKTPQDLKEKTQPIESNSQVTIDSSLDNNPSKDELIATKKVGGENGDVSEGIETLNNKEQVKQNGTNNRASKDISSPIEDFNDESEKKENLDNLSQPDSFIEQPFSISFQEEKELIQGFDTVSSEDPTEDKTSREE